MTKQPDREREDANKTQDWCGFLECELDAHINARIVAEERFGMIRDKSRALVMKYRTLQTRFNQLEQYVRLQGVFIPDNVFKPYEHIKDSIQPSEFHFLEQVDKQQSTIPAQLQSSRDRQVFRSVDNVRAYWQEQFTNLSAQRGPGRRTFLPSAQSTTRDPDQLFLEQMALYNQSTDPKSQSEILSPSKHVSNIGYKSKQPKHVTYFRGKTESPSLERRLYPATPKGCTESRVVQTPTTQPSISKVPEREPSPPPHQPVHKNDISPQPTGVDNVNGEETCVKVSQALRMWEPKAASTKQHPDSQTQPSSASTKLNVSPTSSGIRLPQRKETFILPPISENPNSSGHALFPVQTKDTVRVGGTLSSRNCLKKIDSMTPENARPATTDEENRDVKPKKSEESIIGQVLSDQKNTDVVADCITDKKETLFVNGNELEGDINLGSSNERERSTHFRDLRSMWQKIQGEGSNS